MGRDRLPNLDYLTQPFYCDLRLRESDPQLMWRGEVPLEREPGNTLGLGKTGIVWKILHCGTRAEELLGVSVGMVMKP